MGRRCWSLWLLPQVLGQILLVVNQADSLPANKTIHIGYLLYFMDRGGAINVAIEQAQNDGLLRDYNFRYNSVEISGSGCWYFHSLPFSYGLILTAIFEMFIFFCNSFPLPCNFHSVIPIRANNGSKGHGPNGSHGSRVIACD